MSGFRRRVASAGGALSSFAAAPRVRSARSRWRQPRLREPVNALQRRSVSSCPPARVDLVFWQPQVQRLPARVFKDSRQSAQQGQLPSRPTPVARGRSGACAHPAKPQLIRLMVESDLELAEGALNGEHREARAKRVRG